MKINVEIEIDWIGEGHQLDEQVETRLINSLADKIEKDFLEDAGEKIAQAANKLITAKTELLINTVLEQPVKISDGWQHKAEYDSIYDMVESKMTALYQGKLDNSGKCTKDPLLANIEKYVESHINNKLNSVNRLIDTHAKTHAKTVLKESSLIKALQAIIPDAEKAIDKGK